MVQPSWTSEQDITKRSGNSHKIPKKKIQMINLFNIPNYKIDTSEFSNLLHDKIVTEFEENICEYVGVKYACSINSATNAIFLIFLNKGITVKIPSMIPPVVANGIMTSGNKIEFIDNTEWVGDSYVLHDFGSYKVIDSAQKIEKDQFKKEANDEDLMFFSFYPTKPIGSCDGGIIVSNDKSKIDWFKEAVMNGMSFSQHNWERKIKFPGYKMYMNSIQAHIAQKNLERLDYKKSKLEKVRIFYNKELNLDNKSDHLYRINVSNRTELMGALEQKGIASGIHYHSLHLNDVYNNVKMSLPNSEKQSETTLSIPFHEELSEQDLVKIIQTIFEYGKFEKIC
jgi:UDP-4-amino-4,6-dideoxy-L-N-acetyl-beta-L-altrosamine transaminase